MRIIEKHYLNVFLRTFLLLGLGLATLVTLLSSFRGSGDIENANTGIGVLMYIALLGMPENMVAVMPFAALIAALLTVGHASGALELVAISASGGRLRNVFSPLLVTGLILSLFSFTLSELAVPACARKSIELKSRIMGITSKLKVTGGNIWLRAGDGSMARLGFYSSRTDSYGDISLFMAGGNRLLTVIKAREARYNEQQGTWRLEHVTGYDVEKGSIRRYETMDYPYLPEPSELVGGQNFTARMGAFQLRRYLKKLKAAGFRNTELGIELHSRFASPLVNLIMVLIGVSVAARRSFGALKSGAIGLLVTALYWLMMTMGSALGLAGVLPQFLAAWMSPVLFTTAALWLYFKMPE